MNRNRIKTLGILTLSIIGLLFTACNESAWDSHVTNDELLNYNLNEAIAQKPELSTFKAILKKTGYDQLLTTANSYTVFAPSNDAWTGVDTTDVARLEKIVGNLIAYKSYFTDTEELYKSVKSISGKKIYCTISGTDTTFNAAHITGKNFRTSNGVIQITDKVVELRNNVWEQLSQYGSASQFQYINSLNTKVMDTEKSIAIGVNAQGQVKYDTVWTNINSFLNKYALDNEDSVYTYIVVSNANYSTLYNKYKPYFAASTTAKTDSTTQFNVCQDFVFKGIVDITKFDTLTNVDGVKVPVLKGTGIKEVYNSSNGRVYVIDASNIRLKEKIKPIKIEGEAFTKAFDANYVFTRYKLWASGERDVALACGETQGDTLWRKLTGVKDSVVSRSYYLNNNYVANVANFFIEYKANVNSANYNIYYVAYDDISDHADPTYRNFGVYKIIQKLFISMPGGAALKRGTITSASGVTYASGIMNNYLGDNRCFVGQGKAGVHELTKLTQWDLDQANATQVIANQVSPANDLMTVPRSGTLTMWLCNAARSTTASKQGLLFLDYILLVPKITEE